jgi:hypothetical protein
MEFLKRLLKSFNSNETSLVQESEGNYNSIVEQNFTELQDYKVIMFNPNTLTEEEKVDFMDKFAKGEEDTIQMYYSDPLIEDAAMLILQMRVGTISILQKKLNIGYNRSVRLITLLERVGIVSPVAGTDYSRKEIRFKTDNELKQFLQKGFFFSKENIQLFYDENKIEIENRKLEYEKQKNEKLINSEKESIKQKILDKENNKELKREVLKELIDENLILNQSGTKNNNREPIPQDIMDKVWNRDSGQCVRCGSQENLEFDHIIPFSKGGANTYRNLQILCKKCNLEKSNNIG